MSRFTAWIAQIAGFVMPGLMLVGAILARRQVRLERGDRARRVPRGLDHLRHFCRRLDAGHEPRAGVRHRD